MSAQPGAGLKPGAGAAGSGAERTLSVSTLMSLVTWSGEAPRDTEALYPLASATADSQRCAELRRRYQQWLAAEPFGGEPHLLGVDLARHVDYSVCYPIVEQLRADAIAAVLLAEVAAQPRARLVLDTDMTPLGRALSRRAAACGASVQVLGQAAPPVTGQTAEAAAGPRTAGGSAWRLRRRLLLWRLLFWRLRRGQSLSVLSRGSRILDPLEATGEVRAFRYRLADLEAWSAAPRGPLAAHRAETAERARFLARVRPGHFAEGAVDLTPFTNFYLRGEAPAPGATLNRAPFGFAMWPRLAELSARLVALRRLLLSVRPQAIVLEHDSTGDELLLVEVARTLGIPSACYQHGLPFSYPHFHADRLFLWGPDSGQIYRQADAALASRLVLVGDPAGDRKTGQPFDRAAWRSAHGLSAETRAICLIGSVFVGLEPFDAPWRRWGRLAACVEAVQANPGWHLLLRPHPGDDLGPYQRACAALPGRCSLAVREPLHAVLAASDVVVQASSSVCLDAALLGRPLINYERAGVPKLFDFARYGIPTVGTPAELAVALAQALSEPGAGEQREALARFLRGQMHLWAEPGAAARAGAAALRDLVAGAYPQPV
ncbi:MAG: hypothetical protein ACT4PU_07860 [Planctomycetota bacterium]